MEKNVLRTGASLIIPKRVKTREINKSLGKQNWKQCAVQVEVIITLPLDRLRLFSECIGKEIQPAKEFWGVGKRLKSYNLI